MSNHVFFYISLLTDDFEEIVRTYSFSPKFTTILLYKVVRFFLLNYIISITTKLIDLSVLGKLYICDLMVLGYFFVRFESLDGIKILNFSFYDYNVLGV